ncbi:MAG TPA: hypothetical protein VFG59_12055 [Anaeromyxobacter sp.]|nr:hypothetical protein [Anaeromyxobacter sp.]
MGDLSDQAARDTDQQLADEEAKLLADTSVDWEKLRPEVGDSSMYDALEKAVEQSTARNESLAQLKSRIENLGKEGIALAKNVASILSKA